jgi:hypothetical protein
MTPNLEEREMGRVVVQSRGKDIDRLLSKVGVKVREKNSEKRKGVGKVRR